MVKENQSVEIPNQLYFPIRQAARITGVAPYVLRFWEKEFPALSPPKENTGHRRYRRKDIELILEIKRLLYEQGFTIAGARSQLQKPARHSGTTPADASKRPKKQDGLPFGDPAQATLVRIRKDLKEILTILQRS